MPTLTVRSAAADHAPSLSWTTSDIVKLRADVWDRFENMEADPDSGARVLMERSPELVTEVACQGSPDDIDTREDLTKWT